MKRKPPRAKAKNQAARRSKPVERSSRSVQAAKPGRAGSQLEQVLSLIRAQPGIRPSEINRLLNLEQSDAPRNTLIKRGLIRKKKEGSAMRYYPV
jgi:hypothetical protein